MLRGLLDVWFTTIQMPLDVRKSRDISLEYKFIIQRADGTVEWEEGPNRFLPLKLHLGGGKMKGGEGPAPAGAAVAPAAVAPAPAVAPAAAPAVAAASAAPATTMTSAAKVEPAEPVVEQLGFQWVWCLAVPGRCEDAFFFSSKAAGVADGVGQMEQFSEYGVDAAKKLGTIRSSGYVHESTGKRRALMALMAAEQNATSYGASTALVMAIDGKIVQVANLGDSGFMHLRPRTWGMEILQTSREQTHGWNCPYQLTRVPEAGADDPCGITLGSLGSVIIGDLKASGQADLFTYSALLGALARKKLWQNAVNLLDDMQQRGVEGSGKRGCC
eukprot:Skav214111  [mRNA]  locus=scaffold1185:282078:291152:- [translate_table: standard]